MPIKTVGDELFFDMAYGITTRTFLSVVFMLWQIVANDATHFLHSLGPYFARYK
ncbi:predicted protein [Sclerotinia sclerotiorum 1980 UF-70]|uniref:Uncharacterized protein n=1 Tax=Sclerotinia sclerotiorum (strain ATCC 18683 / 1980 / Ss-1) TaxID=665079 RepID=A7EF25_SCLS1|nr:predicted protein [Sclerotinia sclerotiorum 1980 UF-70]EDO01441.1 predicted protein [Sclerotinia sclerotiorum 1980 UF-70]